jgi:ketosteroid isomerase-like protein
MRHVVTFFLVLCSWAPIAFSQASSNAPVAATGSVQQDDRALIQQIEDDLLKGERTTDVSVLKRVFADDYVSLTPRGFGPTKAELTKHLTPQAGQAPPYNVETSAIHIYLLGDTAVAAYVKTYTAKENSNVTHEDTTHIFTKDRGTWRLRISRTSDRLED